METKRNLELGHLHMKGMATTKQQGKDVIVEGYANANVIDRGNDLVEPTAFDKGGLDNFNKNPIMFFNHNTDLPIGKILEVRPTDKGLYVRGKLSNAQDEFTTRIRELVKEGILRTFSIGFDSKLDEKDNDGVNRIKQAELYEVSIVGIPMNQDSTFAVIQKSAKSKSELKRLATQYLAEFENKAVPAKYRHINFKPPEGAAKEAELGLEWRKEYGRGGTEVGVARAAQLKNRENISPDTIGRMVSFFARHEQNKDGKLDNGEPSNGAIAWKLWGGDPGQSWSNKVQKQMKAADEKESKEMDEDKKPKEEKQDTVIQTLIFSKEQFADGEEAKQWAMDHNFKADKIDETDSSYRIRQRDPEAFDQESFKTIDLTEGVQAIVGYLSAQEEEPEEEDKESEAPEDQESAEEEKAAEGKPESDDGEPDEEDKECGDKPAKKPKSLHERFEQKLQEHDGDITDDTVREIARDLDAEITKEDWIKFFTIADRMKASEETTPVHTGKADDDFGSPQLELAKQTNVLLGTLISRIDTLTEAVTMLQGQPEKAEEEEMESEEDDQEESTDESMESQGLSDGAESSKLSDESHTKDADIVGMINKCHKQLDARLKKLGF